MSNGTGRLAKRLFAGSMIGALGLGLLAPSPAGAAIETATFCAGVEDGSSGFTDVALAGVHEDNVECLAASGITAGTTPTTYSPQANVSRAQMATFVANMIDTANELDAPGAPDLNDLPTAAASADAFTDDEGIVHEDNINRLAEAGVVNGTSATTFSPTDNVTRQQMASFIAQAIEFLLGAPLEEGADAFTDDETSVHEANINRLANADIVDGVGGSLFNPAGLVSRAQMASFIIQALAALEADGVINPLNAPDNAGQVVDCDGIDYTFVNGQNEVVEVDADTSDTFFVDGVQVSSALFDSACSQGDQVEFEDDASATDADVHRLTNVTVTDGMVGNVDLQDQDFQIINPVTGTEVSDNDIFYSDGTATFSVDGTNVAEAAFEAAISEGDSIDITVNDQGDPTHFALTNGEITGAVSDLTVTAGTATFMANDIFGDDPDNDGSFQDTHFIADNDAAQDFTVDGDAVALADFLDAISNGDTITYSRNGGVEVFELDNAAPPAIDGQTVSGFDTTLDTIEVATGPSTTATCDYSDSDTTFRVDGVVVTESEFEDALSSGDVVTCQPGDAATDTPPSVSLDNENLSGPVGDVDTTADTYDVFAEGADDDTDVVLETVDYVTAGDRYFVNGGEVDLATFEDFLDESDLSTAAGALDADDTIEVVVTALAVEHRLTTDNTGAVS